MRINDDQSVDYFGVERGLSEAWAKPADTDRFAFRFWSVDASGKDFHYSRIASCKIDRARAVYAELIEQGFKFFKQGRPAYSLFVDAGAAAHDVYAENDSLQPVDFIDTTPRQSSLPF
jgi:hypothetical protein